MEFVFTYFIIFFCNLEGDHGYNNALPSMHPIFFAIGPDFKKNERVVAFRNIDVFPLMCHLLGIDYKGPIDGTIENTLELLA